MHALNQEAILPERCMGWIKKVLLSGQEGEVAAFRRHTHACKARREHGFDADGGVVRRVNDVRALGDLPPFLQRVSGSSPTPALAGGVRCT
jgi:hypothetical protein